MNRKLVYIGKNANDATGDSLRVAFSKINDNFDYLFSLRLADLIDTADTYIADSVVSLNSNATRVIYRTFSSDVLDFNISSSEIEIELKSNIPGDYNFLGNIIIDQSLTANTLSVTDSANITSNLNVGKILTANTLSVTDSANITSNLNVGETLTANVLNIKQLMSDSLTTSGMSVTDDVDIGANLSVSDSITTKSIYVNGDAKIKDNLYANIVIMDDLTINNSASIGKDLTVSGNLIVNGNTVVNDTVINQTSVYSTDTLFVNNITPAVSTTTGAITTSGGIGVAGNVVTGGIFSDSYRYQNGDSLLWNEFQTSLASPGPTDMRQRSISGFNATNSSDFPGMYYTGLSINGSTVGAQIAINWNGEEGVPLGMYIRSNDDTSTTASWGSWQKVLLSNTDIIVGNVTSGAVYSDQYFYANGTPYYNTGPKGDTGPPGPEGPQGPQGPAGTSSGSPSSVGLIQPSAGNTSNDGIKFPNNPGSGSGDTAWIRYFAYSGENTNLEIGISNDASSDSINLVVPSGGGVGINRQTPSATLDVNGTIKATNYYYSDGSPIQANSLDPAGSAKAWVNFDGTTYFDGIGTGAIRAAFNVSSIVRAQTGVYIINFTNAMPDANYVICSTPDETIVNGTYHYDRVADNPQPGFFVISCTAFNNALSYCDPKHVRYAVFR